MALLVDRKTRNGVDSDRQYASLVVPLDISRRCRVNLRDISKEDKEKATAAKEKYNASPARKTWLEENKERGKRWRKAHEFS